MDLTDWGFSVGIQILLTKFTPGEFKSSINYQSQALSEDENEGQSNREIVV